MLISSGSLASLIRDLYAAAAEPEHSSLFLQFMPNAIGGTACSILVRHERPGEKGGEHAASIGIDDKFVKAYKGYYGFTNIVYEASLAIDPENYIGTLQSCIDTNTYQSSEIYNDYARPQNLFHQCCARITHKEAANDSRGDPGRT